MRKNDDSVSSRNLILFRPKSTAQSKIDTEHPLNAVLAQNAPGDKIDLKVLRDGKTLTISVTLGTRPDNL